MKKHILASEVVTITKQRNFLLCFCVIGVIANMCLAIAMIAREERIVITPSNISRPHVISPSYVSQSYLDDMSRDIIMLMLNVTPHNVDYMQQTILQMVHPSFYGSLKLDLHKQGKMIKKRSIVTAFYPVAIHSDANSLQVRIEGDLYTYIGKQQVGLHRSHYHIGYYYNGMKLSIKEFYPLEPEDV